MKPNNIISGTLLAAMLACAPSFIQAKKMSDLKIYINPGHGGYTSNDRPIKIYPFEQNDTLGYWESKSNLYKGLHFYHILDSLGAKPKLSRIKNTEDDDRNLSTIAAEANSFGSNLFFSIHSNAGENVNYPIMLYRENSIGTPRYPENVTLSDIVWKNIHSSQLPVWTRNEPYVAGDLTFYAGQWEGGLGVLRTLWLPGLLSEGSMHEHRPEAHRLMNDDYLFLEAWQFVHSIMEFYDTDDKFVTGNIAGIIYDDNNLREMIMPANFTQLQRDRLAPVCGAYVELLDNAGNVLQTRTTDQMFNGVYAFRNVTPGTYTVRISHPKYYTETKSVTVTANQVTYQDVPLNLCRPMPLEVVRYSPMAQPGQQISCASKIELDFNTDINVAEFEKAFNITPAVDGYFTYSDSYTKVVFSPKVSLEPNVVYTVRVEQSACTADKHYEHPQMSAPLVFTFETKGRSRLELIDHFPAQGGSVHYASPVVEVRFDNAINYTGIDAMVKLTDANGNPVTLNKRSCKYNTLSNNYGNAQLQFADLIPGAEYTLTLTTDLRDKENLPLTEPLTLKFTATDAASPELPDDAVMFDGFETTAANFAADAENSLGLAAAQTITRSTSTKLFGKGSARLTYKFADTHGGQAVYTYTGASAQFNTGDALGMFINGDFTGHELWVGMASGTNMKYTKVADLDFNGWQYRQVTLDNLEQDFCPFTLKQVKVIQKESPITQNGVVAFDNLTAIPSNDQGVENITSNNQTLFAFVHGGNIMVSCANGPVVLYDMSGRQLQVVIPDSQGNCTLQASHLSPGIYIVRSGVNTQRIAL